MKIDVYSHHVRITEIASRGALEALVQFCRPLVQYKLRQARGKYFREPDRTYAAATKDRKEFRFHINQFDELKIHLRNAGFDESKLVIEHHPSTRDMFPVVEHNVKHMFDPRPRQIPIMEYILTDDFPGKMVTLQTGGGKALRNSALVRIPGGWKRMGLIKVGDTVIGNDGKPTKVLGVYPQGRVPLYRVTFYDGRQVDVCGEHLWQSYYVNTSQPNRWKVRNTLELKRLIEMPNPRVYIPLMEPEDIPDQDLPIDPWLLGVLIGDGCLTQRTIKLSTPDQYIVDGVNAKLTDGQQLKWTAEYDYVISGNRRYNAVYEKLKYLGLTGSRAEDKFVPSMYLESSIEQRKQLLMGLVDTDGYVNSHGTMSYCTVSEQLAKDVQYLVRSLGGMARIRTKLPVYTHNEEKKNGQLAYNVYIRLPKPSEVVGIPKKRERINDDNQYSHKLKLQIKSIEAIDEDEATCITVDNADKLFVVQDFIVTHNTYLALRTIWLLKARAVLIFRGGYSKRWVEELDKVFHLADGDLAIVKGAGGMIKLMKMALANKPLPKIMIISFGTWRDYLKDYEHSNGKSLIYPISPTDFYTKLGISFRVIDEVHQEFHLNYRLDLYTHTYKSLSLSGTMVSSDEFMNRMYCIPYPMQRRNDGGGYEAYIEVRALFYRMEKPKIIRYKGATGGYSHNAFEDSLRSKKEMFQNYLRMIHRIVEKNYASVREDGQKMLIFCASIAMCTAVKNYLELHYPTLTVARYCEDDEYQDLLDADIGVSTVLSAGTAIDIPNLRLSLLTTAINSRQSNEQSLGRTRPLKDWPDVTPQFLYLVCEDIDRHLMYHESKKTFFKGRVLSHEIEYIDQLV